VLFGFKSAEKSILKSEGELVIISVNTPKLEVERIVALSNAAGIPYYKHGATGLELGSICGKPFGISVMLVKDPGKSKVLDIAEKTRKKK
jgi:large subunit ribosomal protein L30e